MFDGSPAHETGVGTTAPVLVRALSAGEPAAGRGHVDGAVAALRSLADESHGCRAWSTDDRAAVLTSLERIDGLVAAVRARLLVAERDAGTSMRPGDASFEAAHARRTRAGWAGAARQVRQADALASMPVVADALAAGSLPVSHLDAVARTAAAARRQSVRCSRPRPGRAPCSRWPARTTPRPSLAH
jgi:hypothetical protein